MSVVPWTEEQKQSFLEMPIQCSTCLVFQNRPQAEWLIVMRDELAIGRMIVDRSADEICLMDIALLPGTQKCGCRFEVYQRADGGSGRDRKESYVARGKLQPGV